MRPAPANGRRDRAISAAVSGFRRQPSPGVATYLLVTIIADYAVGHGAPRNRNRPRKATVGHERPRGHNYKKPFKCRIRSDLQLTRRLNLERKTVAGLLNAGKIPAARLNGARVSGALQGFDG